MDADIPVHTNTTISKKNLPYLSELLKLIKSIGLKRLSMNLLIPCGTAANRNDLWVSYNEIGGYILQLKRLAQEEGITFMWYSPVPMCEFMGLETNRVLQ